jgi:hypothetical protein
MITAGDNRQVFIVHGIDKPIGIVDPAGVKAGKILLERFGLADTVEWVAQRCFNKPVDPLERLAVLSLPVDVALPRRIRPSELAFTHRSGLSVRFFLRVMARSTLPDAPHWPGT